MRVFSQFALRTAQTLALLLLTLTLARPVSSQTTAPDDTIQVIAQQQKVISQTYKLERAGEAVMYLETLALLAAYGDWSRYDSTGGGVRLENTNLIETVERLNPVLIYAKKAVQRNKSVSEDELKRFSDIYLNVETLRAVANDVHDLLADGKIDEANALYRDKSIPLINAIKRDSYTLISSFEKKIDKAALQARLAK
ncbi:hypothetical protein NKI56_08700 [Mesorhizobium sp. M0622]|uniref:hypothetical protein n=1 Tax=unclassified Mesorhizobium TaxID=325217 RepID=UPI00333D71EF